MHFAAQSWRHTCAHVVGILIRDAVGEQVKSLLLIGTSMGGARPKAVVEDGEGLWIAKFNRPDDHWNSARVEHAMLLLARACGLIAAESRVVEVAGRDVLLVRRVDRDKAPGGYRRVRMISALTLLRSEDSHPARDKWSYVLLAEEVRRACTDPAASAAELFRRMCFNALISNADDHPRNHALIAWEHDWRLSPAYDLTPTTPISLEHRDLALVCGDQGRFANAGNLVSQCGRFLLDRDQAVAIVDQMEQQVQATWYAIARGAGVPEDDCAHLGRVRLSRIPAGRTGPLRPGNTELRIFGWHSASPLTLVQPSRKRASPFTAPPRRHRYRFNLGT